MRAISRLLTILIIFAMLSACTPAPTPAPTATAAPSATPTIEPSATPIPPTATPTPKPTPSATPTEAAPVFDVDINRYPESIEDVAGVVRRDKLQADLAILHQKMFEALEAEGVTADQLPFMSVNSFLPTAGSQARGFFPSEFDGRIEIFNMNGDRPARVVLTELSPGDGYVLTIPVDPEDGSGEIRLVDFVIDFELLDKLEVKRQAAGSSFKLMNEAFVKDELMPNLNVGFHGAFFGPFGELRGELLPYAGMLVEADSGTSEDEINKQIEAGQVFVVVKLNIR